MLQWPFQPFAIFSTCACQHRISKRYLTRQEVSRIVRADVAVPVPSRETDQHMAFSASYFIRQLLHIAGMLPSLVPPSSSGYTPSFVWVLPAHPRSNHLPSAHSLLVTYSSTNRRHSRAVPLIPSLILYLHALFRCEESGSGFMY